MNWNAIIWAFYPEAAKNLSKKVIIQSISEFLNIILKKSPLNGRIYGIFLAQGELLSTKLISKTLFKKNWDSLYIYSRFGF